MTISDDAFFKVLQIEVNNADASRRRGRLRPASASLGKAYEQAAQKAAAGEPVGRCACASVRLRSCALLSSFKKHTEALEEACAAVLEMDEMWRMLTRASAQAQASLRDSGNLAALQPSLRPLFTKPPPWLSEAVTTTIQARHCVALELEYAVLQSGSVRDQPDVCAAPDVNQRRAASAGRTRQTSATTRRPMSSNQRPRSQVPARYQQQASQQHLGSITSSSPAVGKFRSQARLSEVWRNLPDPWDAIARLHGEAVTLATALLPLGHTVREHSERVEQQARHRRSNMDAANLAGVGSETPKVLEESPEQFGHGLGAKVGADASTAPDEAAVEEQRFHCLEPPQPRVAFEATSAGDAGQADGQAAIQAHPAVRALVEGKTHRRLPSPGGIASPEGSMSCPQQQPNQGVQRQSPQRPTSSLSPGGPSLVSASPGVMSASPARSRAKSEKDIFTQWKEGQNAWDTMTYLQKKMTSENGVQDMHTYFRKEGQKFKNLWLKEADPDRLYENRVHYSSTSRWMQNSGLPVRERKPPFQETLELRSELQNQWLSLYGFRDQGGEDLGERKPRGGKMKKVEVAREIASSFQEMGRRTSHSRRAALMPLELKAPLDLQEVGSQRSISLTSDSEVASEVVTSKDTLTRSTES